MAYKKRTKQATYQQIPPNFADPKTLAPHVHTKIFKSPAKETKKNLAQAEPHVSMSL